MRIALAQLACVEGDIARNVEAARRAVAEAARLGAECVVLPELHLTGFLPADEAARVAEPWPGATLGRLVTEAAGNGMGLCTSFVEAGDDGRIFNTAMLTGPDGRVVGTYRKTHLFDAERAVYTPGDRLGEPVTTMGLCLGMLVCYDIEFPEASRRISLGGAECILVPSANMDPWGPRHRAFITARALEGHLFVAYCNRCGEGPGLTYPGGSAVIDPMGAVLCEAGADETVICAVIDRRTIELSTDVFDYRREMRPELYGAPPSRGAGAGTAS